MMDNLILGFPAQLKEAISIGTSSSVRSHQEKIDKIILAGMGGSGIGGNIVADIIREESRCPFIILNGYILPPFCDRNTLIIISSYSGNTEETLSILDQAELTGAKIVCITSGGKLKKNAESSGHDLILLPSGISSPRACLGYSFVQQIFVLFKLRLISRGFLENLKSAAELLTFEQEEIMLKAEKIAKLLHDKLLVIYTSERTESVAIRMRQQICENSKVLCWHHVVPEMNHNELVGWKSRNENIAVVFLRNKDDFKRNQTRMDLTKEIVGKYASSVIEIYSKGSSLTEKLMYLVHMVDWISWYLAQLNHVDATEIDVINYLKKELN